MQTWAKRGIHMNRRSSDVSLGNAVALIPALLLFTFLATMTASAQAQVSLVRLSFDTFTNSDSQHSTEVEPDTFAFGSTMVTAFQVGRRFSGGGSSDIGFASSTNGGATWKNGFLPGITVYQGGSFPAASDPSVAFDSAHGVWLIVSLGISNNNSVLVNRSTDTIHWSNPVTVDNTSGFADKTWMVCDNNAGSPFLGHCYVEWDDAGAGGLIEMSTSTDGGLHWSAPNTSANAFGLGGQPVVQPSGKVIVPFEGFDFGFDIEAISSSNGGTTWSTPVVVAPINFNGVGGSIRTSPLPSAEIDGSGKVYVAWEDCTFRAGCSSNDIVMSSSTDGTHWSSLSRVPIDPVTSTIDHFIPGLAVDPNTSGATAHLGITFYGYPVANCSSSTCKLFAAFVSSPDGGNTWSKPLVLLGPMKLTWLANTDQGFMVGDYISTSYVNGKAFGVFAGALAPSGGKLREAMVTTKAGLDDLAGPPMFSSAGEQPVYDQGTFVPLPRVVQ
jgi:hypothetical protein